MTRTRSFVPTVDAVEPRVLLSTLGTRALPTSPADVSATARSWPPETMRSDNVNGLLPEEIWQRFTRYAVSRLDGREGASPVQFFGDSITAAWVTDGRASWNAHFAPLGAADFGIPGSLTQNTHWLLENGGLANRPPIIVLQIGINNLYATKDSARDTALGVHAILRSIRQQSPRTHVLLLAIYPPNRPANDPLTLAVENTNRYLTVLGRQPGVRFLDLGAAFRNPDGSPRAELYQDNLHLKPAGYATAADGLAGPLYQMIAQSARSARLRSHGPGGPGAFATRS